MWSEQNWYGNPQSVTASHVIHPRLSRVWLFTTSGSGVVATMVDARLLTTGLQAYVFVAGTNKISIEDRDGNVLATNVFVGFQATITLTDNTTSAGEWQINLNGYDSGPV